MKKIASVIGGISLLLLASGNVFAGGTPETALSQAQAGSQQVECLTDFASNQNEINNLIIAIQSAKFYMEHDIKPGLFEAEEGSTDPVQLVKIRFVQRIANKLDNDLNFVQLFPNQLMKYKAKMVAKYAEILNGELSKLVTNPNTGCG